MGVPSHSAQERANPPPRRKSCAACIKAKRRCDFAMPACVRCSQRKIHCEYPSRGTAGQRESAKHVVGQDFGNSTVSVDDSVTLPGYDCLPDPDGNRNMALIELGGSENMHAETCTSDMSRLKLPIDMPEWWSVAEHSMPLKAPMSKSLNFASDAVRNRLQFSVDLLRSTPKMMVTDMQTPWYHPLLHTKDVPRSLQDAMSSCALYMAKNPVNSSVIFKVIEARVADLVAASPPTTLPESLAETQALLLYQIIRLFDGDIAARASGELLIPYLETAALNLLTYVRFDIELAEAATLPLYPVQEICEFWESWILHETARRTVFTVFYFLQSYKILAGYVGLTCDGKLGLCLSWTMSARLWDAKTAVEFAQAVREKRYFVIKSGQMQNWVTEARADDVDLFGKLWISSLMGLQETEGWLASKGGSLRTGGCCVLDML